MKHWCLFYLVVVLFETSPIQLNAASLSPEPRIINGTAASPEKSKHLVSIRLKRFETSFGNGHMCGGSLIAANKVLTAAHCLYNADKKKYRKAKEFVVVLGAMNRFFRENGTIVTDVTSIAYMNSFSMDSMRDDVGLMFLKHGLPAAPHLTIAPIPLGNATVPDNALCEVSGWGLTERNELSHVLLTVDVVTINNKRCMLSYGTAIHKGMLCAGHLEGGRDSCKGDSGGPLVYNGTLIGVVSWGNGCAEPGYPGVYSDVQYYREWIEARNYAVTPFSDSGPVLLLSSIIIGVNFLFV